MAIAAEALQLVRELADGTLVWQEPLSVPGTPGQCAVLLDEVLATQIGATQFAVTPDGDWLAVVNGVTYAVLAGVIPDTGRFIFIGRPLQGTPLGDPLDVRPRFNGNGNLTATVRVYRVGVGASFGADGSLAAELHQLPRVGLTVLLESAGSLTADVWEAVRPRIDADFASLGSLTAELVGTTLDQIDAALSGDGSLTATTATPGQIGAVLAGGGSLSAVATTTPPIAPPLPGGQPMSYFDFRENGGPITESTPKGYTLTTQDPTTAWAGNDITGRFDGVVGYGRRDAWKLSFIVTVNPGGGGGAASAEVEGGGTDDGRVACGVLYSGGAAYPQLYDDATGDWKYNLATAIPANANLEWTVVSDPAKNTTVLRVSGQPAVTLNHTTVRHFDTDATLLGDSVGLLKMNTATYSGNTTRRLVRHAVTK